MKNQIKVLIIDDDKYSAQSLSEAVKRMGFKPLVAHKPSDALNIVKLQTAHAAIIDVLLPKTSGVDLAQEMRKTRFGNNPIIFVSGVFKDKKFASNAKEKVNAVDFLFKPFSVEELDAALKGAVGDLVTNENWTVQSFLVREFTTPRERLKAVESIETIKGMDLAFVLSFLMGSADSGTLNIVNEAPEVFGIHLIDGRLTRVDSAESEGAAIVKLISQGFLSQEDWDKLQAEKPRKLTLETLVEQGYVSPHAANQTYAAQMMEDLTSIFASGTLQMTFVPDDVHGAPSYAISLSDLLNSVANEFTAYFSAEYLLDFYSSVMDMPLSLEVTPEEFEKISASPLFNGLDAFKTNLLNGGTLRNDLPESGDDHARALCAFHFAVLHGALQFKDPEHERALEDHLNRYQKLYDELKSKTADQIFTYFGANENLSPEAVNKIYEVYVKSNGVGQLGFDANAELKEMCMKCLALVSNARETLLDPAKRDKLFSEIKDKQNRRVQEANQLLSQGLELLRHNKPAEALEKVKEAGALAPSSRQLFIAVWAEIKAHAYGTRHRLNDLARKLESVPPDERRSGHYWMALGLVKKTLGDGTALACFEKALQLDPLLSEAKRELDQMQAHAQEKSGSNIKNILTGDISEIVTQLFKRKSG